MYLNNWPYYEEDEVKASLKVLETREVNYWTGNETNFFEKEFADYTNNRYAVAVANGSIALDLAYRSIKDNSSKNEIITTPRTYIATSSSAVLQGLTPVFADVDFNSGLITPKTIEPLINKNTLGISVVHLAGVPADMNNIKKLAANYNLKIIEDCSQSHGAKILNSGKWISVGSFGDLATWSFCQDKIISTGGEGGMVTMHEDKYWDKIWSYKDHGKSFELVNKKNNSNEYRWLHKNFGTNYRLTEFQSAIGRKQLSKLDNWIKLRTRNANILNDALMYVDCIRVPKFESNIKNAWYKYYVYLKEENLRSDWSRTRIIKELNDINFPAFSGSCSEIYLEECFKKAGLNPRQRLKNAKLLGETSLMFLVHHTITEAQMHSYAEQIKKVCNLASK